MSDVQAIVDRLGRKQIAETVRVSDAAIGNALSDGRFPAWWYRTIRDLCAEDGVDCPMDAFKWEHRNAGRRKTEGAA